MPKKQGLIEYTFIYKPKKPQKARYIERVIIRRLWQTNTEGLNIGFNPEQIKPQKKEKAKKLILF